MTESKKDIQIDLARIDTHAISEREYAEIPELTHGDFTRGRWGASRTGAARDGIAIDADILDRFRATGPGWEDRINRILRQAAAGLDAT